MTTTAKVTYRDHVPWNWYAIEFCEVDFYGERSEELARDWFTITHDRFNFYDNIVNSLLAEKELLELNIKEKSEELKKLKPWYRFWHTKKEKMIIEEIESFLVNVNQLNESIKEHEDHRFYEASEKHLRLERFLKEKGLVLTAVTTAGGECITYIEMWEDK